MTHDDNKFERRTGNLIRETGIEEPSAVFTGKVMESVRALPLPEKPSPIPFYYWFVPAMVFLIGAGWYLAPAPGIMGRFFKYLDFIPGTFHSALTFIEGFLSRIAGISFSPMLIIVSIAAISLLILDALLPWKRIRQR